MMSRKQPGFTLIELLLYVGVAAVILLAVSFLISQLLQARVHNQVVTEVEEQGRQVLQLVTTLTRNAKFINAPGSGVNAGSVSLKMVDIAKDPTVITLTNGAITVTEGAGVPTALTSNRVTASALTFSNLSSPSASGTIRMQLTLTHVNISGRTEYSYAQTFRGSATIRK